MKKKVILSMLVIASLSLTVACSNEDNNNIETNTSESNNEVDHKKDVEKGTDAEFIKDIEKATQARWKIISDLEDERKEEGQEEVYDEKEDFEQRKLYVKAESDILYKYDDSEFKDPKLKKLATDYIEGLKKQEKSMEYYYGDQNKWSEMWSEGMGERSVSLLKLIDEYGVEADEKQLESLRQTAQVIEEDKKIEDQINEMTKDINFTPEEDSGGWKEYVAVVENTTETKFDQFNLNIKLVDQDGVTIDTTVAQTENWNPDEKVRFSFGTDKTFNEIQWTWEYYNY